MNTAGILVHNISDCLQTAADSFDWTKKENVLGIIVQNFGDFVRTYGKLPHLRVNSGLYVYTETQLRKLTIFGIFPFGAFLEQVNR